MSGHKKKPRQRNRPKHKANRLNAEQSLTSEAPVDNCISVNEREPILNSVPKSVVDNEVPIKTEPSQPQSSTDNEAIKIIQKLIREKFLKNQSQNETSNEKSNKKSSKQNSNENPAQVKKSKSKENVAKNSIKNSAFITNLQKQVEHVMANDSIDLSNTFLENLQKLINQTPITDVETTDDEEEYIEYVYRPRQYFSVSLCNYCKCDLSQQMLHECRRCRMVFYCKPEHMKSDEKHRHCCYALRQVAENCGGHIFYKCGVFTMDEFRSYRIVTARQVESILNRSLTPTERETILFPRICTNNKCREYRFSKLMDCKNCGQVAFCKDKQDHLKSDHILWCEPFRLFKELIIFQEKYGRLEPTLPTKVLKDLPGAVSNTQQMFIKLNLDMKESCEYAVLSQIATGPLSAWYALKLCEQLRTNEELTIHLIGAEIEFEVDTLHKWELFFLHITPHIKILNIVFIGPELKQTNISFEQLQKTKCCRLCRKSGRTLNYYFENVVYHDYRKGKTFSQPNLICFFNAGLYRSTGFQMEDSWPETIDAAVNLKCPITVTSYTAYESPLDMKQILQDSGRCLNIILPPTINPFASTKPERNFISEEDAPLIFKNYYCFVVE